MKKRAYDSEQASKKRILAVFRRGETYKAVEGVGLRMAIVAGIAERHKGRVWAEP